MPKKKTKAKKKVAKRPKPKKAARTKSKKVAKKPARKKSSAKKGKPSGSAKPARIPGTPIGKVTHYFGHVNAAVVKIKKGQLQIGDRIHFKGHTTDFGQTITSLQIDRKPIEKAGAGDEIGVEVTSRVREDDTVYKL